MITPHIRVIINKKMKERMEKRFNKGGNALEFTTHPELPGSLNIELTSACNHNCVTCCFHSYRVPDSKKRAAHTMDYETVDRLLTEAAKEGVGRNEVGFHMTGESVLHKDFAKCVKRAKDLGFPYVFTTSNGVYMTPEKFVESAEAGLDSLRFSINGYDRESYKDFHGKDDFDTVMKNLKFMSDYKKEHNLKMSTSISVVLTKKTIAHKADFEKILGGGVVDELVFIPVLSLDRVSKEVQDMYGLEPVKEFEYTPCASVFNSMYISSEGYVVPCCSIIQIDGMILGDIHKTEKLSDIWFGETFCKLRQDFMDGNIPKKWCEGCALINKKKPMLLD